MVTGLELKVLVEKLETASVGGWDLLSVTRVVDQLRKLVDALPDGALDGALEPDVVHELKRLVDLPGAPWGRDALGVAAGGGRGVRVVGWRWALG